jgi:MFS family permease
VRSTVTDGTPARTGIGRFVPPLLRETQFRRFWIGQTISVFGDQVTLLALPIIAVLVLHADPAQMGVLTAAGLLPHLFFSLPAGVWLDRVRQKRRLMILADLGRALAIATIPIAFVAGMLRPELLFIVTFVVGCLSVVFDIAWNTIFVSVTRRDQFVQANALLSGSRSLSNVGGPSIAGILIQVLGGPVTMLLDAASFVGSAAFLRRIQAPEAPIEEEPGGIREQLGAGLSFIFRDPIIRTTVLSAATLNLFNFSFFALFILYVTTSLGVVPGVLGLVLGAGAVGGVLGAIVAPGIGRRLGLGRAYLFGLILFPASLIPIGLVTEPYPAVLAMLFATEFGAGIGVMILDINAGAMLQARTPDRIRARAGGTFRFINYGIRPIGALLGGALGSAFGVREALIFSTVAALSGVLWLIRSPILQLNEMPEPAELDP